MDSHRKHLFIGISYMMLTWLFFSLFAAISKLLGPDAPLGVVMFFQNVIALVFLTPWFMKHGFSILHSERKGLILFRSVVGVTGVTAMYLASIHTTILDAILLSNAAPIFLPFIAWIWIKTPIEHKLWPGILFGFMGIALILKPGKEIFNAGALYGLANAVLLGISMLCMRMLSKTERNHTVLFYFFLTGLLLSLPFAIWQWTALTPHMFLLMGLLGASFILGQLAFQRAFHYAKPVYLAPFCYSGVIFSGLIEWIGWDKIPDLWAVAGTVLVCIGGVLTIIFSNKEPTAE